MQASEAAIVEESTVSAGPRQPGHVHDRARWSVARTNSCLLATGWTGIRRAGPEQLSGPSKGNSRLKMLAPMPNSNQPDQQHDEQQQEPSRSGWHR